MIQTIAFHTTHTHAGIKITPYPAGHVLGAAMYVIEIAGLNILFTGDYSREHDRHLIPASAPKGVKVDVLITESTFGVASHIPRLERETALMKSLTGVLNRGGRVLMPVFAIGRAQELLLILEDYWNRHPEYRKYPIYYASNLAKKCMLVYQTYIDAMNDNIKSMFQNRLAQTADGSNGEAGAGGPWDFRWIRNLKSLDRFDDVGGCVMLASPGMLQNGVSRALLERWAPDPKNGVIVTGYSVEGTMAKMILTEPESIQAVMTGRVGGRVQGVGGRGKPGAEGEKVMIPRRCTVQEYSFAAHVDGTENREFIEEVAAPVVVSTIAKCSVPTYANALTTDFGSRREDEHDETQIQAAILERKQVNTGQGLLTGKLRRASNSFPTGQDCQSGRSTCKSNPDIDCPTLASYFRRRRYKRREKVQNHEWRSGSLWCLGAK
jgi:cleavage and polyadenylation specificity factor subunit 3